MEKIFELKTRSVIYQYILRYPGLHYRELIRKLDISGGTLRHHLNHLIKQEALIAKHEGRYTRYYVAKNIGNEEKKILHLLRQNTPRNIILYLITYVGASQIELSKALGKNPKTIEFHLKRFRDLDIIEPAPVSNGLVYTAFKKYCIIERTPVGKEIIYRLKNPILIYNLFYKRNYNKKLYDNEAVRDILEFLELLSPGQRHPPKKIKYHKNVEDKLLEAFFEIFPHPYHV